MKSPIIRCLYCKTVIKITLSEGWTGGMYGNQCLKSPDRKHTPGILR